MKATLITKDNRQYKINLLDDSTETIVWTDVSGESEQRERVFVYEVRWPAHLRIFREKTCEAWTSNLPLEEELDEEI